jgi:hypothetical protein
VKVVQKSFFLILGAKFGLQSIPEDWLKQVTGIEEIIQTAEKVTF